MKCQKCKEREANVQIVQQELGKKPQTFMLCDVCAREMGISIPTFTSPVKLNNPFAVMGNAFQTTFGIGADDIQRRRTTRCARCNLSFDEFRKTGFLGCPDCYEAFGTQLDPVFCRTQMGKKHLGRKLGEKVKPSSKKRAEEEACTQDDRIEGIGLSVCDSDAPNLFSKSDSADIGTNTSNTEFSGEVSSVSHAEPDPKAESHDHAEEKPAGSDELSSMEKKHRMAMLTHKTDELKAAVEREDYLTAARLRDEITELKMRGE